MTVYYTILEEYGVKSITCHLCGMTSYNPNDVENVYCGNCHRFLKDLPDFCQACDTCEVGVGDTHGKKK